MCGAQKSEGWAKAIQAKQLPVAPPAYSPNPGTRAGRALVKVRTVENLWRMKKLKNGRGEFQSAWSDNNCSKHENLNRHKQGNIMSANKSYSKTKATIISFCIAFSAAVILLIIHLLLGISYRNVYSYAITGLVLALVINFSSRKLYHK